MPNQDPSQNQPNQVPPAVSAQTDLPPMPPDLQQSTTQITAVSEPTTPIATNPPPAAPPAPPSDSSGSAAPPDLPPVITSPPKKKFAGGRIIATILGLFLLVGGATAGIFLTQQKQIFQPQAGALCNGEGGTCVPSDWKCGTDFGRLDCSGKCGRSCVAPSLCGNGRCDSSENHANCPEDCEEKCTPSCSGKACGQSDGCSGTCSAGSGCTYCSAAKKTECTNLGGSCTPNSTGGFCSGGCGANQIVCNSPTPHCVNYKTDNNNCGSCGHQCQGGLTCDNGTCSLAACPGGLVRCGTTGTIADCKNLLTDNNNCGVCGFICTKDPCNNGKCTSSGTILCGGVVCPAADCHCTGGDACTGYQCDSATHQSCLNQNRAWCINNNSTIGYTCCVAGYQCGPGGKGCIPGTGTPGPTAKPTAPPNAPQCVSVKAYGPQWGLWSNAQLAAVKTGQVLNFCVTGSNGTFDKAQFKINGAVLTATTTKRPNTTDYCQSYTIKATDKTVNVYAQIHAGSGWVGALDQF